MGKRRHFTGLTCFLLSVSIACGISHSAVAIMSEYGAKDAMDSVREGLARNGLQAGFDPERKTIIEVVSHEIELKDFEQLNESVRRKAMEIAYLQAVARIAEQLGVYVDCAETATVQGASTEMTTASSMRTSTNVYARALLQAESCMPKSDHIEYMAAIAVVSSEKFSRAMAAAMNGDIEGMPGFKGGSSLKERMDNGMWNHLGPQIVHDAPRHFWIVGTASHEIDDDLDKNALRVKAAYAAECALGGNVDVEGSSFTGGSGIKEKTTEESLHHHSYHLLVHDNDSNSVFEKRINVTPFLRVNPLSGKIRWHEREEKNPMTGKRILTVIAAIDSNYIPYFIGDGALNFTTEARQDNISVIEHAKKYIESKGWRTGLDFVVSNKFAVAIGGAAFKYTPSMDGAAFAQKRNDAVRRALMESAMNVAFTYDCSGELKKNLSDGNRTMRQYYGGDEAVERIVRDGISFCDDSDVVVDLKEKGFMWWASFSSLSAEGSETERKSVKEVEGYVKSKMPIHGLKVERQFESIVDGVYQIAFVVTCDPKRGRDIALSFANEKSREERGKLPLGQWIAEQDFGMMAGPRQYVDDKGDVWMIGIAPAAEGCRPFGASLDGMAREYAAFGLSGDFSASYAISSLNGPAGEYSEREAEILYSAESSPTGKNYPKEFELVFHRAFTHPLTGRKGEVSICALRSGTKELVDKLTAEQIKEKHAKAKEQERKKGIRDSLLKKELKRRKDHFNEDHR